MSYSNEHRLTIAYDAKRAYLNYRGLGNYCRNLFAQLKQYYGGNRYLLCTPEDKGLYPWLNEAPFERVMPSGLWSLSPSIWRRYGIPMAFKEEKIDIYHGLSQELPEGIERLGCKTIVTMHDAIFLRYPELYSATYRRSFTRRNESACRRADLLIAISEQTKRDYMEFFRVEESHIKVVYQGCNALFWIPVSKEDRKRIQETFNLPEEYILSVGALEERKNQIRIIEGMGYAKTDLPLVMVGRGSSEYKQRLQECAKQHGVQIRIIENASQKDLPAIYRMASAFVYPSLFEGFGIPILEAARCEVPIIASSGTCFEEIAGEGALYVSPMDSEEIGEAIRNTLLDRGSAHRRVITALHNTEKFCEENRVREIMEVYHSVL